MCDYSFSRKDNMKTYSALGFENKKPFKYEIKGDMIRLS